MKKLPFTEIQKRISDLADQAIEENMSSEGDINVVKKLDKEIIRLRQIRNSMPEWIAFLKELKKERETEELPF